MDNLGKHSPLNLFQHGFRQKRICECETQLIIIVRDFADCLINRKGQIDAVLLDFSKVLEKIDHDKLLTKLQSLGIGASLHLWIWSFLFNCTQTVLVPTFKKLKYSW